MFSMCLWRRKDRKFHSCFLVGPVVRGEPVAYFNRSIIWVRFDARSVETGTFGGMENAGGKIQDIEWLGRVTVPVEDHLWVIQHWVEETLESHLGGDFERVIKGVKAMMETSVPREGTDTMQLDVFSAVVVNRMENKVFVYKKPSSFP